LHRRNLIALYGRLAWLADQLVNGWHKKPSLCPLCRQLRDGLSPGIWCRSNTNRANDLSQGLPAKQQRRLSHHAYFIIVFSRLYYAFEYCLRYCFGACRPEGVISHLFCWLASKDMPLPRQGIKGKKLMQHGSITGQTHDSHVKMRLFAGV
jgi:hypothetical protein